MRPVREGTKKARPVPGLFTRCAAIELSEGPGSEPYFFEDDLRDFFEPPLFRELDFFDDLELDLELDFDELFLVADFAIAVFLSVPFQKGHGNRVSRHDEETTKRCLASNRAEMFGMFIH